ncbi:MULTISPECIES: integrase arm-type DNA-binding domain-containing protein [unclassified Methylophilus]|uniref:tyrosine-type recombinase/integrase n=1 Tax=unclassified Methylophilus TaxID=2630143 RepID=UPI0006FE5FE1|nr:MULTISPECIES: integrase arm-type DNA-binding domain-containing protein [unclassified Methylophilus]KQT42238.1 integrase [Methylophilus sp. Leaf416]KQT56420.1 integrase [Methylophilus sp. Leaf459]
MALTDTQLRNAKPADKDYTITDGQGLSILITSKGAKGWRFRYRYLGKPKLMSFGTYPEVTLQQARARRDEARALVAKDIDPGQDRKEQKQKAKLESLNTFQAVATEWHALHNKSKSERHQQRVKRWLEFYLYPTLGHKAVSSITAPMVLDTTSILQKQGKLETAHRVIQTAGQVFRYAIQKGFASYNPAPDLKGALPPPVVKNMAAMIEPKDFADLLRNIDGYNGTLTVQCALKLAPLLFQRIGELRHMKWADLDFENNEWRYLVTKTKTQHIVPLSRQALAIIEAMRSFSSNGMYVFPGGRTHERPMSENAINAALRNMGYDTQAEITGHGFRAIAQTLGEQELGLDPKHIERQLAHSVANPLGTAYERAQFLKDRKVMMQRWADYLDELKAGAKVLPFKQA